MPAETLLVLSLVRAGYGSISEINSLPVSDVLDAFEHLTFTNDYAETIHELNKADK